MVNVLYFASFREVLGKAEESIKLDNIQSINCLIDQLADRGDAWKMALQDNQNLQIAVNHAVATRDTAIKAGDEVAFFPPVTGG